MRRLLSAIPLALAAASLPAGWTVWEDFDTRAWSPEPWPITEHSTITWDTSRAVSGQTSLATTIDCAGWGGGITLRNTPLLQPPTQGMTVSIFCEAEAGATGAPAAKLEVYRPGGGDAMGSPDTPLTPGEWTTVTLPASAVTEASNGAGIVFLPGNATGRFRVWVDALMRDGDVWEDFEYSPASHAWPAANIDGPFTTGIVGNGQPGMPPLESGHAQELSWEADTNGAEMKIHFEPAADFSAWQQARLRVATAPDAEPPRASLWVWDGTNGTIVTGDRVAPPGQWNEITYNIAAGAGEVNLAHVVDFGLVFHEYSGASGHVFVDRLEIETAP